MENVYYDGAHSITFVNSNDVAKNTWTDWGLVPSSRHSLPTKEIWSNAVTIAGVNGQEDLVRRYPYNAVNSYSKLISSIQNDNPAYILEHDGYSIMKPTSGSFSFIIADQEESYFAKSQEILNFLHNKKMRMAFSDDLTRGYVARITVSGINSGQTFSTIDISYSIIEEYEGAVHS